MEPGTLMSAPVPIVFFNDFYDPNVIGGVEVFLLTLAKGLRDAGNRIQIITPRYQGSAQTDSREGIWVKRIGAYPTYRRFLQLAIGSSPRLRDRLDARECRELVESLGDKAIMHFHNLWGFSPTLMRRFRGPRVVTVHDYWPFCVRRVMVRIGGELCEGRTFVQCAICHTSAPTSIGSMNPLKPQLWYKNNESLFREVDSIIAPSQYMKEFLQRNLQNPHEIRVIIR